MGNIKYDIKYQEILNLHTINKTHQREHEIKRENYHTG